MSDFNLIYNGLDFSENSQYSVFSLDGIGGVPIRTSDSNLTDQDGGVIYKQLYAPRIVSISLGIMHTDSDNYFESIREIINAFTLTDEDNDLVIVPWTTAGTPSVLRCRVITEPVIPLVAGEITHNSRVFIQLKASNPFFTEESETAYGPIQIASVGGAELDAVLPMALGSVSGGNVTIPNDGDRDSYARFVIDGELVNPIVTNTTTGESWTIETTVNLGEQVELEYVDGSLRVVNGTANYISYFSGTFFDLEQGNNTIVLSATSGSGTLTIYFRNEYKTLIP